MSLKPTTQKFVDQFVLKVKDSSLNLSLVLFATIYLFFSVRYPQFNFDDLAINDTYAQDGFTSSLTTLFFGLDVPSEYRTYSFSRCLQFVLLKAFGENPFPFYLFMAATHLASAYLIFKLVSRLYLRSRRDALGCALIWTFSPFSICHTFHHFT